MCHLMTEYYGGASAQTRILEPRDHEVTKHATLTLDWTWSSAQLVQSIKGD